MKKELQNHRGVYVNLPLNIHISQAKENMRQQTKRIATYHARENRPQVNEDDPQVYFGIIESEIQDHINHAHQTHGAANAKNEAAANQARLSKKLSEETRNENLANDEVLQAEVERDQNKVNFPLWRYRIGWLLAFLLSGVDVFMASRAFRYFLQNFYEAKIVTLLVAGLMGFIVHYYAYIFSIITLNIPRRWVRRLARTGAIVFPIVFFLVLGYARAHVKTTGAVSLDEVATTAMFSTGNTPDALAFTAVSCFIFFASVITIHLIAPSHEDVRKFERFKDAQKEVARCKAVQQQHAKEIENIQNQLVDVLIYYESLMKYAIDVEKAWRDFSKSLLDQWIAVNIKIRSDRVVPLMFKSPYPMNFTFYYLNNSQ